jgi:hypothetical protein
VNDLNQYNYFLIIAPENRDDAERHGDGGDSRSRIAKMVREIRAFVGGGPNFSAFRDPFADRACLFRADSSVFDPFFAPLLKRYSDLFVRMERLEGGKLYAYEVDGVSRALAVREEKVILPRLRD